MNLSGKIVLVTGSTDGVGREVTLRLGAMGVKVLLHGRDRTRGEALAARLGPDAMFYPADFAALAGVRGLATTIQRDHSRLDVLISNAGIGTASGGRQRAEGADGHELRFAVNHLAGFLLTRLLLPLLKASAPARIVRVSSAGQYPFDFDDVMLRQNYDGARAYMQKQPGAVMFTIDLAQELVGTGITANCLHPATYMDTTMVRASGTPPISTVAEGADAILHLAVVPELEGESGFYFDRKRPSRANTQAYDVTARRRLREFSYKLTGLAR